MIRIKKLDELSIDLVADIYPKLREFFDQITFDNYDQYIMGYEYGPYLLYESFNFMPSSDEQDDQIIEFEQRKLFLFLNGVLLYHIQSMDRIILICDAYDIEHKFK